MGLLKLTIDRQAKTLVEFNGSVTELPPLYQINTQQFRIQVVDPTGSPDIPYEVVDCSANALRMIIAASATGEEGDEAANRLAATLEAGWGWDAGLQAFLGSLNLHTAEIAQEIGQDPSVDAILEINLMTSGVPETIFGQRSGTKNVTIQANADDGSADAPAIIEDAETIGTKTLQDGVGGVAIVGNRVSVTDLALGGAPANVFLWINCPAGSGAIAASFEIGSATADGFSFLLSGVPPNNNYSVTYVLIF